MPYKKMPITDEETVNGASAIMTYGKRIRVYLPNSFGEPHIRKALGKVEIFKEDRKIAACPLEILLENEQMAKNKSLLHFRWTPREVNFDRAKSYSLIISPQLKNFVYNEAFYGPFGLRTTLLHGKGMPKEALFDLRP